MSESKVREYFYLFLTIILIILIVLPNFLSQFLLRFMTEILVWMIFAMAFDLIYGYTGMLSFGQSLFFGVGSYAVAISVLRFNADLWTALSLAVVIASLFAWFVGYFSVRLTGIHFVLITIIFSLIALLIGESWVWLTGGDDGLTFKAPLISLGFWQFSFLNPFANYYFVLASLAISYLLMRRIVNSPLGKIFKSIRENEDRASLIGYDVKKYKLISFIIAGAFSGLSGALFSLTTRFASAHFCHWVISGKAVVWTIVGGAGTLLGPVLGTGLIMYLEQFTRDLLKGSEIVVGGILIFIVLTFPQGIVGLIKDKLKG